MSELRRTVSDGEVPYRQDCRLYRVSIMINKERIRYHVRKSLSKLTTPGGWEEDRWRITQPGNRKWFLAEHENGVMIWLVDPGGRGDNWQVKAGTSTRLSDSSYIGRQSFNSKAEAEAQAGMIMAKYPDDPDPRQMYPP